MKRRIGKYWQGPEQQLLELLFLQMAREYLSDEGEAAQDDKTDGGLVAHVAYPLQAIMDYESDLTPVDKDKVARVIVRHCEIAFRKARRLRIARATIHDRRRS